MLSTETLFNPPVSQTNSKHSLLPLLTVLFVISYSLMAMLVIEQGNTITSQRWLIKQLFVDSTELTAIKNKAVQQHNAQVQAQAQARSKTQSHAPSSQVPSQERPKARKSVPEHPPKPTSDLMDARRMVVTI